MGKKNKARTKTIAPQQTRNRKTNLRKRKSILPWLIVLSVVTFICFLPTLKNNFTNWDDEFYVINNALLRGPDWQGIFTKPVVSNYHPLTIITLAINFGMSGTDAWSYLLFNLIFHLINAILAFIFIYRISGERTWVAFLTALLFAIHPMHVESVAWVSERKDVLYTLFFILSLIQYWKYLQSRKTIGLWLCFLFFTLSLLSKPAAIVLPLVLFVLDYWHGRPLSKKIVIEKIPFFIVSIFFTVITLKLQSATAITSLDIYPLWDRLFFACYVITVYFIRFFIPYPLSAFHPFPDPGNLGWEIYLSPLFILLLGFFLWRFRMNKVIVFGFMFFLVNILLVLQLISVGFTIVSERYTYVPYIGLAFTIAALLEKSFMSNKKWAWAIGMVVFAVFGFVSFNRTKVWKDSDSLWSDVISHYPESSLPRADRAQYLYNKAISMPPEQAAPVFKRVIDDCTVAIQNSQDSSKPQKRGGEAIYYMRAIAYNSLNQYEQAFNDFNRCLSLNPNYTEALYYRGTLLVNRYNKNAEALLDFNKAIQLRGEGKYYLNRSICYYKLGDMTKAKADGEMALKKGIVIPGNYRRLLNL